MTTIALVVSSDYFRYIYNKISNRVNIAQKLSKSLLVYGFFLSKIGRCNKIQIRKGSCAPTISYNVTCSVGRKYDCKISIAYKSTCFHQINHPPWVLTTYFDSINLHIYCHLGNLD
jgi:hypothetical protein